MSEFLLNISVQYSKSVGKSMIRSAGKIISLVCQFSHEIWMLYCTEKRNIVQYFVNLNREKHSSLATTAPGTFPFGTSMNINCLNCSYITCSLLYNAQNIFPSAYIYGNHITLYYETNMCKSEHIFFRTHDWLPIFPNSIQYVAINIQFTVFHAAQQKCISVYLLQ